MDYQSSRLQKSLGISDEVLQENFESVLETPRISNKTVTEKVERCCTVVNLINHRKLKLFGHLHYDR